VDDLLRVIEEQRAEIRALRNENGQTEGPAAAADDPPQHAQCGHIPIQSTKSGAAANGRFAKRQKTVELTIHETIPVPLEECRMARNRTAMRTS